LRGRSLSESFFHPPAGLVYQRRKPETTVLYRVLQEHLETFLARVAGGAGGECKLAAFRERGASPLHGLDGTKALVFAPEVFIEKLCAVIPPPRQNLVSYFGVFAPNAALRPDVVPPPGGEGKRLGRPRSSRGAAGDQKRRKKYSWAELMKRVFEVDVLVCPFCGGKRKLIAQITRASAIRAFLTSVGLPAERPILKPALWPP